MATIHKLKEYKVTFSTPTPLTHARDAADRRLRKVPAWAIVLYVFGMFPTFGITMIVWLGHHANVKTHNESIEREHTAFRDGYLTAKAEQ